MSTKSGIPSWQQAQASSPPPPPTTSEQEPQPEAQSDNEPLAQPTSHSAEPIKEEISTDAKPLLEQASRFLEDPAIRDAPREKKVAFLQSKGVQADDIERLLPLVPSGTTESYLSKEGERLWSKNPRSSEQTSPPKPRDIPPIVTYPEFLAQPVKAPPLITTNRLLNTAYITGGVMATIYGLSKYIIAPMTQNLAEARHDFASHTKEKLDELNSKLGDVVSIDPANNPKSVISEIVDDISEADSDPTELFHRDIGTQTTPTLSRRPSTLASSDTDTTTVGSHERRLKILTSHLQELEATRSKDTASSDSLRTKLSDLQTYLTEMSYQTNYYSGFGGIYGGTYGLPKTDKKEDHIEALKADIRAVKGVLLSARNFPAGGPRPTSRLGV